MKDRIQKIIGDKVSPEVADVMANVIILSFNEMVTNRALEYLRNNEAGKYNALGSILIDI